jgi:phage terminase large subunit-like protein
VSYLAPEHERIAPVVSPALALTIRDQKWLDSLSPEELIVLLSMWELWARPEQRIPTHGWSTCGYDGARGFGKTAVICAEINRRVEAGEETLIGLMAPTEERTREVQIDGLIAAAPPWFVPEQVEGGLRWPNGVKAEAFTSATSGGARGGNYSLAWFTEIVDYKAHTREEAFRNLATATRKGRAQIFWDSTSKGRNEVLEQLRAAHARDPRMHPIIGGTMFQNLTLDDAYLRREWWSYAGVRREEEILGRHFSQAEGALWEQAWIDATRVDVAPTIEVEHVGIDPAFTTSSDYADETGLSRCGRASDGHVYVLEDRSGRYKPDRWGDIALDWMPRGGRCTIETNQGGDMNVYVLRSRAETRGLRVREIGRENDWPEPEDRVVFVRRQFSRESKGTRADGPSVEWQARRCHIVGELPDLEREMTTYVPGSGKSPNRLDAVVFAVTELRELNRNDEGRDASGEAQAAKRISDLLAERTRAPSPRVEPLAAAARTWARPRLGM